MSNIRVVLETTLLEELAKKDMKRLKRIFTDSLNDAICEVSESYLVTKKPHATVTAYATDVGAIGWPTSEFEEVLRIEWDAPTEEDMQFIEVGVDVKNPKEEYVPSSGSEDDSMSSGSSSSDDGLEPGDEWTSTAPRVSTT